MLVSLASQFECELQHAVNTPPCENRLLNSHLFLSSFIEAPANVSIFPLVVLTDEAEINLAGFPVLQRSFNPFKKSHGAQIYVLTESAADRNQQAPERNVIRHTGMSNSAKEDGVKRPELLQTICRHHLSGLNVGFTTPVECVPVPSKTKALSRGFQHADAFGQHFFPDAVSRNDCNIESFHVRRSLFSLR